MFVNPHPDMTGSCAPMPDATQARLIMPTKQHSPVGWIRRSRRIRHEQRAQNPPSLRLNPFRHFRPLTAKDNFFRFFLKLIAIHRVVIFFK